MRADSRRALIATEGLRANLRESNFFRVPLNSVLPQEQVKERSTPARQQKGKTEARGEAQPRAKAGSGRDQMSPAFSKPSCYRPCSCRPVCPTSNASPLQGVRPILKASLLWTPAVNMACAPDRGGVQRQGEGRRSAAWVQIPTRLPSSCVTLGEFLSLSGLGYQSCEVRVVMASTCSKVLRIQTHTGDCSAAPPARGLCEHGSLRAGGTDLKSPPG